MKNNYWHDRWQSNEIAFNQETPNVLLKKFFPELFLKPKARVFVPLCGKSIDMIWLVEQGYEVIGVELSELACVDFFKKSQLEYTVVMLDDFKCFKSESITLFSGDFFNVTKALIGDIDVVYDRAALIALPFEMRSKYTSFLMTLLSKHSEILLLTTSYEQNEMQGPPFSVNAQEVKEFYEKELLVSEIYQKAFSDIPKHLKAKGLFNAVEHVFHLFSQP